MYKPSGTQWYLREMRMMGISTQNPVLYAKLVAVCLLHQNITPNENSSQLLPGNLNDAVVYNRTGIRAGYN
jgi:hypothetical protein